MTEVGFFLGLTVTGLERTLAKIVITSGNKSLEGANKFCLLKKGLSDLLLDDRYLFRAVGRVEDNRQRPDDSIILVLLAQSLDKINATVPGRLITYQILSLDI